MSDEKAEKELEQLCALLKDDLLPKMRASSFVMGLIEPESDPFVLMQVGAALLLDKPLILIAMRGASIPAKARQLAEAVLQRAVVEVRLVEDQRVRLELDHRAGALRRLHSGREGGRAGGSGCTGRVAAEA